jgi:hypothetical protein
MVKMKMKKEGAIPIWGTKGLSTRPRCITLMTTQLNTGRLIAIILVQYNSITQHFLLQETIGNKRQSDLLMIGVSTPETC